MKTIFQLLLTTTFLKLFSCGPGLREATLSYPCHTSADCPVETCCRRSNGDLITLTGEFNEVGRFPLKNGTCVPLLAQRGEHCGDFCPCDANQGLICFREHVQDNSIEPSVCLEKSFVKGLRRKWDDCYLDPNCQLPFNL